MTTTVVSTAGEVSIDISTYRFDFSTLARNSSTILNVLYAASKIKPVPEAKKNKFVQWMITPATTAVIKKSETDAYTAWITVFFNGQRKFSMLIKAIEGAESMKHVAVILIALPMELKDKEVVRGPPVKQLQPALLTSFSKMNVKNGPGVSDPIFTGRYKNTIQSAITASNAKNYNVCDHDCDCDSD